PGVMQSLLMVGMAWNDLPWISMATLVTTEADVEQAHRLAADLAERAWNARRDFVFHMETASVEDGIACAAASKVYPVYRSDGGDNTTAGAPSDLTIVLKRLLAALVKDVVVAGVTAPETVRKCRAAGVGAQVELALGQEHIATPEPQLAVKATVEA